MQVMHESLLPINLEMEAVTLFLIALTRHLVNHCLLHSIFFVDEIFDVQYLGIVNR